MEVSDILKVAYELLRVKEDRLIMSFEDDRSNLIRNLDFAHKKVEQYKARMKIKIKEYDHLYNLVKQSKKFEVVDDTKHMHVTTSLSDHSDKQQGHVKRKSLSPNKQALCEQSNKRTRTEASLSLCDNEQKENKSIHLNLSVSSATDLPIDHEWIGVVSTHKTDTRLGNKRTTVADSEGFITIDRSQSKETTVQATNSKTNGNKTLRKHQSCIQLPSRSGLSSSASLQKQNQLEIAPKKIVHRSISTYTSSNKHNTTTGNIIPFESNARATAIATTTTNNSNREGTKSNGRGTNILTDNYKCVDVIRNKASRDALPGHTCVECEKFYDAMVQQGVFSPGSKQSHLQDCSRHKSRWTPPTTPDGYWDLTVHTPEEWKHGGGGGV